VTSSVQLTLMSSVLRYRVRFWQYILLTPFSVVVLLLFAMLLELFYKS